MKTKMLLSVILSIFLLAPSAFADEFTEELIADLEASGFQVSQGYPALYTQQDCYDRTYPILGNCFGANPAAPYVLPVVKTWPDEYVDPATVDAFVETDPGYSATYRLDQREALVIYGEMPPPGRYMGLQTFEFSQHGKWRPRDYDFWANTPDLPFPIQYLFSTIPPDDPKSQRIITLSSLGDVVNNVVMEQQSGYPFGEVRYFITTPSASTDRAVREALQAHGIANSHIFTEPIPRRDDLGPIGPLGMGKNAIDFLTAFRYAVPDDTSAAELWRENPPLTVLRVRAPASLGPVQRYGSLVYAPRTAKSELDMEEDLEDLVAAVCESVSDYTDLTGPDCGESPPDSSFLANLVSDYGWTGPYCRDIGMDCLGDQQEAAYYLSTPRPTGAGQVYAVIATLATETENAVYVGLSANDASIMGGVPNGTLLDTQLKGSADDYVDGDNAGKFFVHYFTENCEVLENVPGWPENCTEISGMSDQGDPELQGMIIISLRNYIAPGTTSGPDSSQLLAPRILTFTGASGGDHGRAASFRAALEADGFILRDGQMNTVDPIVDLLDSGLGDSANGNNAGQPYKVLAVPTHPFGENNPPELTTGIFHLRPDEAVVYVGSTPPRCDYFSFTTFLWTRHVDPRVRKGDWMVAAVNDPLNNALIRTEGNGNPFRKQTIVIFTADQGVYGRVAAQARAAGYPESMINPYVIPSGLLHLGVLPESPRSDSLIILVRTANFTSPAAGTNYLKDDSYARVWRVTPDPAPPPDPFPTPEPRARKWLSEMVLFPGLEQGLERLEAAIRARTPHARYESFESIRWFAESRDVLEEDDPSSPLYHKFVAGEASDTPYLRTALNETAANFTLGTDDMVVVYGVNHVATGLATYSSFGVYGDWITSSCEDDPFEYVFGCGDRSWNGVVGRTNHDFTGSAEEYIPGDPMAPYFYAVRVSRQPPPDKHDRYWVTVPTTDPEHPCASPGYCLDLAAPITIGYRAYLNPATGSGADYDDIIPDRAIWFSLR